MADDPKPKWVLPPSLYQSFNEFITLYETLYKDTSLKRNNQPILIMGPPGVGKTLFSEVFANCYKEDNKISNDKIVRVNIASFPETLIESILFGHKKGAFTNAITETIGFVEKAAGGILILDEIGELSKNVQAKLLTFIEDKYYYKVGKIERSKSVGTQIIATTNKTPQDDVFRQDFIDRFFLFYIPPLYQRRGDILYHWVQSFPDIVETLSPWEILAIIAYHWPGNVREIERIGNLIQWQKAVKKKSNQPIRRWFVDQPLFNPKIGYTSFDVRSCFDLHRDLKLYGIDVSLLQKELLTKYRINLSYGEGGRVKIAFPESHGLECNRNPIPIPVREFIIENIYGCKYFEQAYKGLEFLCSLLKRSVNHGANILDLSDGYIGVHSKNPKSFIKNYTRQHERMVQAIRNFVEERASTSKRKENDTDIFKMTEKEMIEYHQKPYLEGLLKRTAGNQTEAAKMAGLPLNTFRDHCKKYGLS